MILKLIFLIVKDLCKRFTLEFLNDGGMCDKIYTVCLNAECIFEVNGIFIFTDGIRRSIMIPFVKLEEVLACEGKKTGYTLLDERHGCVNGSKCGVSFYKMEEYGKVGCHDDQEGFFVLEGHGKALIGGEEIILEPGVTFMVPAHVEHCMKKDKDCDVCKVFWFHAAI